MGLDLYAGTLTRYYARNWMTATQQWAEENGYTYNRVGPGGPMEQEQKPDPAEVRAAMEAWRDSLLAALKNGGTDCAPWPEDNDAPYYTDKPDWDAWCALILAGACAYCGEEVPARVPRGFSSGVWDRPVVKKAAEERKGSLFAGAELWLPFPEPFWFACQNPVGNQITVATTGTLLAELTEINGFLWQAEEQEVLSWITTQGYPPDGEMGPDGRFVEIAKNPDYDTQSLAKLAYSILYRAAQFSKEHQAPIVLDY